MSRLECAIDESVIQDYVGKRVVSLLSILPRGKRPSPGKAKIPNPRSKIQFQRNVKEGMDRTRSDLAFLILNPLPLVLDNVTLYSAKLRNPTQVATMTQR